jgi:hypothetical protein
MNTVVSCYVMGTFASILHDTPPSCGDSSKYTSLQSHSKYAILLSKSSARSSGAIWLARYQTISCTWSDFAKNNPPGDWSILVISHWNSSAAALDMSQDACMVISAAIYKRRLHISSRATRRSKPDRVFVTAVLLCQARHASGHDIVSFFLRRIEVTGQKLVHGEHVDFVLLEDRVHGIVASDLTLVTGVL